MKESIYYKSWSISPWQILSWGFRQLGLAGGAAGEDKLSVGELVVVANVEQASKEVLSRMSGRTSAVERVFSKDMFIQEFGNVLNEGRQLSQTDFTTLLRFLSRDKQEVSFDGRTIKFKSPQETIPTPISQQDNTIASLKTLIASLTSQVSLLEGRISTLSSTAHTAVQSKNRVSALSALKSRKLAESNLKQRSDTLAQLEEVYTKIEQAADQVEIVRVMEASTGVLKGLHKQVGGVDRVEDVVDELRDEMGKVDEVNQVLGEAGQVGTGVDDDEIDEELKALEDAETEKQLRTEKAAKEERERKEALETQRRLAELENTGGQKEGQEGQKEGQKGGEELDESIKKLSQMSLDANDDELVQDKQPTTEERTTA